MPENQQIPAEVVFSRTASVEEVISRMVQQSAACLDAALYRFNNPRLGAVLEQFAAKGKRRQGSGSKMHHKFAILDSRIVLTGSYNWTLESQEANFENLVILSDPVVATQYEREFEVLWEQAAKRS